VAQLGLPSQLPVDDSVEQQGDKHQPQENACQRGSQKTLKWKCKECNKEGVVPMTGAITFHTSGVSGPYRVTHVGLGGCGKGTTGGGEQDDGELQFLEPDITS